MVLRIELSSTSESPSSEIVDWVSGTSSGLERFTSLTFPDGFFARLRKGSSQIEKDKLRPLRKLLIWWPLEDSNLQPKDYESKGLNMKRYAVSCI